MDSVALFSPYYYSFVHHHPNCSMFFHEQIIFNHLDVYYTNTAYLNLLTTPLLFAATAARINIFWYLGKAARSSSIDTSSSPENTSVRPPLSCLLVACFEIQRHCCVGCHGRCLLLRETGSNRCLVRELGLWNNIRRWHRGKRRSRRWRRQTSRRRWQVKGRRRWCTRNHECWRRRGRWWR